MNPDDIMGQAMMAQSGQPPSLWKTMQSQGMANPLLQLGLGILSANKPGASFGQAVGQGGLTAMQNMQRIEAMKAESEHRKLQAEQLKTEMERAKAGAARQAELEQRAQEAIQADPTLEPFYALGGAKGALDAQMKRYGRQLEMPDILYDRNYKERQLVLEAQKANQPDFGMVNALLPDGTTTYGRTSPQGSFEVQTLQGWAPAPAGTQVYKSQAQGGIGDIGGLSKPVVSDLQKQSISAKTVQPRINQLISDLQLLPSGIGGIAEAREGVGGIFGQLADIGVPGARGFSDAIRPEIEVVDPAAPGGKRIISGQTLKTQLESLTIQLKPMIADSGPLSNQDRMRLDSAVGMLASSDSKRIIQGLMTIAEIVERNGIAIDNFLTTSGATVPGRAVPSPDDIAFTAKKYGISEDEVRQRLGVK